MVNGESEQGSDFLQKPGNLRKSNVAGGNLGVKVCSKKSFTGVNVADSTENFLIEEQNLDGDGASPTVKDKPFYIDFFIDWIPSQTLKFDYFLTS